ncbi:PPC domain-containing DNA-binding protein [Kribbella sp. NPDC051137]|uniref:PPC domain-containing DNA-binding protein n=1 Tax=Kribbella sp. NPDC051137 TaxID=3155045 RepID=UPI003437C295
MSWKLLEPAVGERVYAVIGEPGDDAVELLGQFARAEELTAAQLTAVGAFSTATVGWFDREAKDYRRIEVGEQCEVLSLLGDIALGPDGPAVHLHAVLGLADGQVRGGHLLAGEVWPTLEVIVREAPGYLRKTQRPDIGLALVDLEVSRGGRAAGGRGRPI